MQRNPPIVHKVGSTAISPGKRMNIIMGTNNHLFFKTRFGDAAVIYREKPFLMIKTLLPRADGKSPVESLSKTERGKAGTHPKALVVSESVIDYFKGKPLRIPWEWMDLCDLTELQKAALAAVADIPYGKVKVYKDIAQAIGRPGLPVLSVHQLQKTLFRF